MLDRIKKFFCKDNFIKTKLIISAVMAVILAVVFEYKVYSIIEPFPSKNRIIFIAISLMIVFLHFIIKLNTMYEFLYKNRYKFACAFLLFVMIGKYSGSSITSYNIYIQPGIDTGRYHTLLGIARQARSDEWASSTDYILSQGVGENKFEYYQDSLRGAKTDMFTLINAPVLDVLMLGKPFQIGFLLFGNSMGLSFYWYVRLVAMFLGAFELCMIVTNKNKKISLLGAVMISFSSAVQWWYCLDCLIWSQIILVLANLFLETDKRYVKYLSAFGILAGLLSYLFVLYPPWQIAFAYFMVAMLIWIVLKNWKNYKINVHDVVVVIVTLICFGLLVFRWLVMSGDAISATMNTAYPGARTETGGFCAILYQYIFNIFMSFKECLNACEYSSMLSFFPIPMILGTVYLIRNRRRENVIFLLPMLIISTFMTIWCIFGFPEWLAKITLMTMSTANRASLALGTMNIYILIYLMGNIKQDDKFMKWWIGVILGIISSIFVIYKASTELTMQIPDEHYVTIVKIIISSSLFVPMFILIFNLNKQKCQTAFLYLACFTALLSGLCVNPIIRTTDIIYEKPASKKMQEIREKEPDAIWISENCAFAVSNYMVANGLRTLNSTSVYPNLEFYEELLGDKAKEQEYNYNRYAHHTVFLTDEETNIILQQTDYLIWNLNYKDLKRLNISYILSNRDINELGYREFEEVYHEDNVFIFKVK
ncbi:MAG: hypothetical protein OSJ66_00240 [Clostridia bacterium]|nr:hypothetical protein [Clostridia bacterium]